MADLEHAFEVLSMSGQSLVQICDQLRLDYQGAIPEENNTLHDLAGKVAPISEACHNAIKEVDQVYKLAVHFIDHCETTLDTRDHEDWNSREINKVKKALDEARKESVEQLKLVRYYYRHGHWLLERFPEGKLRDVEGLVKLVSVEEIAKNDWSLTPGRYVGVAPEEVDEDFDFEQAIRDIHAEIQDLNAEAVELAAKIARNFEELGV